MTKPIKKAWDSLSGLISARALSPWIVPSVAALITLAAIVVGEVYYVEPSNTGERIKFLSMVGGILGGGAFLMGAYFTWRQLQITLNGQVTDRLSKAVEYIGSENLSIRLGGLYSLERIALDSSRDLPKIIEILCAYIRVHSPSEVINRGIHEIEISKELTDQELSEIVANIFHRPRPKEDIHAALQIISKITRIHRVPEDSLLVVSRNLFGVNVKGARLPQKSDLSYFFFDNSQLDYVAIPADSKLIGIRICHSDLRGAFMDEVNLSYSDLSGSALERITLRKATLIKARFIGSRLACANLIKVVAKEASFNRAKLRKALFSGAKLKKANFGYADLRESNLNEADLSEVDFGSADLSRASFKDAKLNGAKLYKADLTNAKYLTDKQLEKALLCQTTLPDGTVSDRDCERLGIPLKK
jgi:uncharacterized protein YjbI with pentapeptide repeats